MEIGGEYRLDLTVDLEERSIVLIDRLCGLYPDIIVRRVDNTLVLQSSSRTADQLRRIWKTVVYNDASLVGAFAFRDQLLKALFS